MMIDNVNTMDNQKTDIVLRPLDVTDAGLMLEWMHDPEVQKGFKKNMLEASLEDALKFIKGAALPSIPTTGSSLHFAIANEEDEYMGTISLKNLDMENGTAEYAITTRKKARGTGTAFLATGLLLKKAFEEYGLQRVYLSVYANNVGAIRLYEHCGFQFEGEFRRHFLIDGNPVNWKWYGILKEEFDEKRFEGA